MYDQYVLCRRTAAHASLPIYNVKQRSVRRSQHRSEQIEATTMNTSACLPCGVLAARLSDRTDQTRDCVRSMQPAPTRSVIPRGEETYMPPA